MRSRVTNTNNTAVVRCNLLTIKLTEPEEAIVYATFTQGDRVFKDAVVVAEVSAPEPLDNSTKFRLYDNGRGLGSSLNAPSGDRDEDVQEPVPVHSLVKQCGFFSVTTDIFYWQLPPAYVSDLRVTATVPKPNGTLLVQLTWTWPGAHMHIGNASGVTIRASQDLDQLQKNFDNQTEITSANVVEGNLDPLPPGSKHVITIALPATFASPQSDGEYSWSALIALRVTNSYGRSSKTSYIVDASYTPQGIETWVTATTGAGVTVTTEKAAPTENEEVQLTGFRRHQAETDSIADVMREREHAQTTRQMAALVLRDVKGAFNYLQHPYISLAVEEASIAVKLRGFVEAFLTGLAAQMQVGNALLVPQPLDVGTL
ncbi:uncharacterized protein LOC144160039 [Haemaphysalis longicornis]